MGPDMHQIPVRPADVDDRSNAMILSFGAKWAAPIKTGSLKWLIRKRVPLAIKPDTVYFHVNAPVSVIIAKGRVKIVEQASTAFVLEHSQDLQMAKAEILEYVGDAPMIGLFRFDYIELASKAATLADFRAELEYFPPQSFSYVSRKALPIIDRLCGF
jgi:predicted transcriptional regulator